MKSSFAALSVALSIFSHVASGQSNIVVAIIDTGVDTEHQLHLQNKLWKNPGESGLDSQGRHRESNSLDDDSNGYIDDVHGWNFAENNNNVQDVQGHGTHIASIIDKYSEAKSNFMVLRYFDSKHPERNLINSIHCFEYAIAMRAQIINYSGGGTEESSLEKKVIKQAQDNKILLVAAAGNEGSNNDHIAFYPASYHFSNIISVTALDLQHKLLPSSNFGSETVHIATLGQKLVGAKLGGGLTTMTGSSQATALLTGKIVKFMKNHPEDLKLPEKVKAKLQTRIHSTKNLAGKVSMQGYLETED